MSGFYDDLARSMEDPKFRRAYRIARLKLWFLLKVRRRWAR